MINLPCKDKELIFLDWINNFLSVKRFAEYYSITPQEARIFLKHCKELF